MSQLPSVKSVLSASQFKKEEITAIIDLTRRIEGAMGKRRRLPILEDYILSCLFFEPSTRTRLSFEAAMHRLGGRVVTSVGVQFSSLAKGETLFDTLKMVEGYSDICVIRHSIEGASTLAAENISIPVINGGDGAGEHPTQGLLDIYTIAKHKPLGEKPLTIAFVGDIKYGRTIHSLIKLLAHFDVQFIFISPEDLRLPARYGNELKERGIEFLETEDIKKLADADVAYVTRIQEERFVDHKTYERFKDIYIVNLELMQQCKKDLIVMHPLPRLNEVDTDLDDTPHAVYFEQAKNGLYTRMSLLLTLLQQDLIF